MAQGVDGSTGPTTVLFVGGFGGPAGMQLSTTWGSWYGAVYGEPIVANQTSWEYRLTMGLRTDVVNGILQGSTPKSDSNFNAEVRRRLDPTE